MVSQCKCPLDCEELTYSTSIIPYSIDVDSLCNEKAFAELLGGYHNGNEPHVFFRLHQQAMERKINLDVQTNHISCKYVSHIFQTMRVILLNSK